MFTYCFNNDFIFIFISLLCILYFMMTNAATRISRFGTIKFYCIVLYFPNGVMYGEGFAQGFFCPEGFGPGFS